MNHYAARQRKSGIWDWTLLNDDRISPTGACSGGTCTHATKEEAEAHEQSRVQALIRTAVRHRVDTIQGRHCAAHGRNCQNPAFSQVMVENIDYILCDQHLNDPSWYLSTEITSSW